jgi:hypothetical protein
MSGKCKYLSKTSDRDVKKIVKGRKAFQSSIATQVDGPICME